MKTNNLPTFGDMPAEEFRRYGYALIDRIADYFEHLEGFPVLSQIEPGWLEKSLPTSPPKEGEDFANALADVDKLILPAITHWNHPNFHGLFSTSTSSVGIFGEMLAATFDMKAMLWRTSPASTELEDVTLNWLRQMLGLPAGFEGIIYDTASVSTMHAMAAARERAGLQIRELGMSGRSDLPLLRVYTSEHVHSSIDKSCITLGLGLRSLRKIGCNERFEMIPELLADAIEEDIELGRVPICVMPTIGTTSTSSIDPVDAIADICEKYGVWLHVDAAYAGPAALLEAKRPLFRGWERADSIVLNPHKWLFTPFDLSVLYCRDLDELKGAFSLVAEYLKTNDEPTVKNGMDYGIQLGRRFRALKLWFVIRYFGVNGLAERIREHCRLAQLFASWVEASDDFEMMAPVTFSLVCFRAKQAGMSDVEIDALNERIMNAINASGEAYLSHTKLNGKYTLRLSVGSIRVEERHLEKAWRLLNEHFTSELEKP
ncbi:pyridoxal phosphate-dependent decarboxylase family protein [Leptolyngbya sp. 7M]|uniref:pyridoxal phosphate-dependent decarboxylase family protein n=1 Tax=Leptolyngbya sp. 7M TaxID=2812896 RepID=UPI001B8CA12C|nr:pyridoxal-dependent decarboxylase [Leptolyngbya sp. 7M]QYO65397.1 aspartate aminotransferase family protein [Leptolyngbya sp. 7M]